MLPDLERAIALQKLDTTAHDAQRRLAEEPERSRALDARLDAAKQQLADAKDRLTANQTARRDIEKDVAVHQGRLSKFREQAMNVKTNQEFAAIQKEIAFAQGEIKTLEDRILERMLEADDLAAANKRFEKALAEEQKAIEAERKTIAAELAELSASVDRIAAERASVVSAMDSRIVAVYNLVASRRHGVAVAEARDFICTICHVRLRPQVFNNILKNDAIIQCDSCQRILYFVPAPAAAAADSVSQSTH